MRKKYLIFFAAIALLCILGGFSYYKINYLDTVTEYYKLTYIPPMENTSSFGYDNYTKPKFEIQRVTDYINDSIAVVAETKKEESSQKFYNKKKKEFYDIKRSDDVTKELTRMAKIEAVNELTNRQITILRFTHRRGYNNQNLLSYIKSYNGSRDGLKKFCDKNKIEYAIYPIYE